MFKNFFKQHVISLRTFLLLLLAGTVLYYSLNPDKVIQKGMLETHIEYSPERMRTYIHLPNLPNLTCMLITPLSYGLKIHVRDFVGGQKPELTLGDVVGEVRPWWDADEACVRMVVHQRDSDMLELLTIHVDENLGMDSERRPLWRNSPITEVYDSTLVVNGLTFHPTILIDSSRAMELLEVENGYRIGLSRAVLDSLGGIWAPAIDRIEEMHQIAEMVSQKTGVLFETKDVYRVLQTFRRNSWYKLRFIDSGHENYTCYGMGRVEGTCDCNGDGRKELLIATRGDRYLESTIACWDLHADSLRWKFATAGGSILSFVADIDHDGRDEIAFGTNAPGNQMCPCWHDHPEMGITAISYFYILDDDGSVFHWDDMAARYEIGGFGSTVGSYYDRKTNSALIVEHTDMDRREKRFLQLHLDTGVMDSLSTYRTIKYYYRMGDDIVFWDWQDGKIIRKSFSPGMKYRIDGVFPFAYLPQFRNEYPLMIGGEPHFVINPFKILDDDFNVLYEDASKDPGTITELPDKLLFIDYSDDAKLGHLAIMTFQKNTHFNPVAPLLFGFELLLLIIWWAVHNFIMTPIASADKGYVVLWSILGKLYIWKPLGKASIYKLPKYIAFDKKYFASSVGKLSRDFRCIFKRNLIIMDFTVYEMEKVNELEVVQHIAHELKNRLLVMQYSVDDDSEEAKADLKESIRWSSYAAKVISDFSRVHTLKKEPVDIRDVVGETVHTLMARPNVELLELVLPDKPLITPIDRYLMKIALRNLIENALQAIDENGWIKVEAEDEGDSIKVRIANPGTIDPEKLNRILTRGGYSSKQDGTGVGVSIARVIVSNHDGTLEMTCHENIVEVFITLSTEA